jgi:hypothetical protein
LYTCIVLFDLSRRPRLLGALGSRYPVSGSNKGKQANVELSFQRKKYEMLTM